jgi:hypothetical protein
MMIAGLAAVVSWVDFAYLRLPRAWLGIVAALALVVTALASTAEWVPLLVLAVLAVWVARTTGFGLEGSDEMALIILPPLAMASLPIAPSNSIKLVFLFVAAQLMLAYLASAGAKAAGAKWRNGTAVAQILSTRDYGLERRDLFESAHPLFLVAAWGTIGFEFALPLAFLLGGPLLPYALVAGVTFHIGIAVTMGLNRFLLWFVAAYPAATWVSLHYGVLAH